MTVSEFDSSTWIFVPDGPPAAHLGLPAALRPTIHLIALTPHHPACEQNAWKYEMDR
jgi:hypothetical protein